MKALAEAFWLRLDNFPAFAQNFIVFKGKMSIENGNNNLIKDYCFANPMKQMRMANE